MTKDRTDGAWSYNPVEKLAREAGADKTGTWPGIKGVSYPVPRGVVIPPGIRFPTGGADEGAAWDRAMDRIGAAEHLARRQAMAKHDHAMCDPDRNCGPLADVTALTSKERATEPTPDLMPEPTDPFRTDPVDKLRILAAIVDAQSPQGTDLAAFRRRLQMILDLP